MRYNFINYQDKQPLFVMEGEYNTLSQGNSIKFGETIYIIERIQNVLKRGIYPYVIIDEVNVYIKDQEDYYYD